MNADHEADPREEIGHIPEGWNVVRFGTVREWLQYGTSVRCRREPTELPVLRIPNIELGQVNTRDLKFGELDASEAEKYRLKWGDLIFIRTNGVLSRLGSCAVYENQPQNSLFASYLIRARLKLDRVDPHFAAYFFASERGTRIISGRATPAADGKYNLNSGIIDGLPLPLPPSLDEQRDIARALDRVREARKLQEQSLAASIDLKRTAMRTFFTRGLKGEAQKETEIGPMPESWEPRTILSLCEIQSGGTPRKSVSEYWAGEIPWASGKDLKTAYLHDTIDHVSEAGVDAGSRIVPADAVLILVRGMGLAKDLPIAVISRPMAFNQDLKALVSRGDFVGKYIRSAIYCAKDRLLSKIVPSAHGTMTLNLDDIETFKIPCPSNQAEANEVVSILDAIDRKIELHKRKQAALDELFNSLLHKLMTGDVSLGDLDLSALSSRAETETAA